VGDVDCLPNVVVQDQPFDVDDRPVAWQSLYSTVSRPFPVPETGKIAVKVINHYGDEVLQVYDTSP
jgi:hypothetical protein